MDQLSTSWLEAAGEEEEEREEMRCRLCHGFKTECVDIYTDLGHLTLYLPVHVRTSDPPALSSWVCPVCVDQMKLCRQFFSQVITCYSITLDGTDLTSFVKEDMLACLNREDIVKQELEEFCEQKLEDTKPETKPKSYDLDSSFEVEEGQESYIKEDESDVESEGEVPQRKRKRKNKAKLERGKRKKKPEPEESEGGLLVMRKRKEKHIKILSLSTMCTCSLCGLQSSSHLANQDHWRSSHPTQEMVYQCNEDEEDCRFSTPDLQLMKDHLREHLFKLGRIGQCEICAKYFPKNHISHHIKLVHELEKTFECKTCNKRFKTERILKTHELIHEPDDARYRFSCHVCGQRFTQRGNLDTHLKIHLGLKPFKCGSCEKAFTTSSGLKAHNLVHTGERPFLCDSCDATFKSSTQLKTHVMEKHLNLHRYQCTYCPVKYNRMELLRNHEMSHTGETPFKCSTCGKGFRRKDKLRIHEILHGPEESKYRFECEVCGKRFTQNNNLKTHRKSHHSSEPKVPPPRLAGDPVTPVSSPPVISWPPTKL